MPLTERQNWLIDYLKRENSKDPSRWIPLQEIVDAITNDLTYDGDLYTIASGPKAHNPCTALWNDKEEINASLDADVAIIYGDYAVKIPSSVEEADEYYAEDLIKRGKKLLRRASMVRWKARRDGQMVVELDAEGNPTERFVEALMRDALAGKEEDESK